MSIYYGCLRYVFIWYGLYVFIGARWLVIAFFIINKVLKEKRTCAV